MKTLTLLTSLALSTTLLAEHSAKEVHNGFLKAAQEYDTKADLAEENGNDHNAAIYRRLAEIKREAAQSKGGYDWSEYHKLTGQLKFDGSHKKHNKKKHGKKHSFDDAAKRYDKLAQKALDAGDDEKYAIYARMAEIKREAQASNGKYDWREYHELEGKLNKGKKAKKHHKPGKLIPAAQKHAALANKFTKEGDDHSAQIHTRLAAILIDAAAKKSNGEEFDWSEYKELKKQLEE